MPLHDCTSGEGIYIFFWMRLLVIAKFRTILIVSCIHHSKETIIVGNSLRTGLFTSRLCSTIK